MNHACQRDDRLVLPLPDRLKGGAAAKVITSLITKGFIKEVRAKLDQPAWRETDDDKRLTLVVTDAAFEALGITPDDAPGGTDSAPDSEPARQGAKTSKSAPAAPTAPAARKTREGSKQARLVEMLQRPEGVTIAYKRGCTPTYEASIKMERCSDPIVDQRELRKTRTDLGALNS